MRAQVNTIPIPRSDIVVRVGKYGPYLERGSERQTLPPDIAPDELTPERAEEILAQGSQEHELGVDPETRPHDRRADGPLRAVRDRGPGRRREAAHGVAASQSMSPRR